MHTISNELVTVKVKDKGAELQSIYHNQYEQEYLWSGNILFWGKKSPVLFPIVGELKDGSYTYNGRTYKMNRHGFAREHDFKLIESSQTSLTFSLASDEKTKEIYPFDFLFTINYTLVDNKLVVTFDVHHTGTGIMYFSVGAHPAFAVPLEVAHEYDDYFLKFEQTENANRWPISKDGLIETEPTLYLENTDRLQLKKELFFNDAIVFKDLQSTAISILSDKTPRGVKVHFEGFPYMGLWAAKRASFVCIEPWCGIADSVNASGRLEDKEGIMKLGEGEKWSKSYSIEVF